MLLHSNWANTIACTWRDLSHPAKTVLRYRECRFRLIGKSRAGLSII
jgi:hypothetical protein